MFERDEVACVGGVLSEGRSNLAVGRLCRRAERSIKESYIAVLDSSTYEEKSRIVVPGGPSMQIFSPDGKYGYVYSSFIPKQW